MQDRPQPEEPATEGPKVRTDLVFRAVDEDLVVYDPLDDRTSLLNPSAAAILELCDGTRDARAIAGALRKELASAPESLERDVERLLADLGRRGFFEAPRASG
jgi:PqqD family protein of HPr-rel-A system